MTKKKKESTQPEAVQEATALNVSCLQENLARGLGIVARAISTRSLPVLGTILLATEEGRLRLSATDLELSLSCWIGAVVETDGAIAAPARTLVDLVNTLPPDRVDMRLVGSTKTLNLACGRVKANLKGLDAQDFPLLPHADLDRAFAFSVEDFREMISHVVFAAATDEARPVLSGVLVKVEESGQVTLAAADGFRLSVRTTQLGEPVGEPAQAIIPARALGELGRVLKQDEPVRMSLPPGRGQVVFRHGEVELVAQLIEGTFPDFSGIIPKSHATRAVLGTADFRKACKSTDVIAREASHSVRLKIAPGGETGHVTLTTSAETGDNTAELDAAIEGGPIEIAFNVKYLLDALNAVDTPQVALETSTPTSPGVIKPVGRDDFIVVVMPLHIGSPTVVVGHADAGAREHPLGK